MKTKTKWSLAVLVMISVACGEGRDGLSRKLQKNNDKDKSEEITQNQANQESSSEAVSDEALTDQMDEASSIAADAINSDSETINTSAGLNLAERKKLVVLNKSCEESTDGTALVTVDRETNRTITADRGARKMERSFEIKNHEERVWSKEGETIGCKDGKDHAELAGHFGEGLKLQVNFERSRSLTLEGQTKKGSFSRERHIKAAGERKFSWLSHKVEGDKVTNRAEIISSVTRNLTYKDSAGKDKSIEMKVETDTQSPMVIEREKIKGEFSKLTIISGKMRRTGKEDSTVSLTYDNVVYTSSHRCNAESGKIYGTVTDASGSQNSSFTIDFASGMTTVTHVNGKSSEFVPEGCALETESDDQSSN